MSRLDKAQLAAATATEGPVRLIAGAGTYGFLLEE